MFCKFLLESHLHIMTLVHTFAVLHCQFVVLDVVLYAQYSTRIVKQKQLQDRCIREIVSIWKIECRSTGFGTLRLYRMKNGTEELIAVNDMFSRLYRGRKAQRISYRIENVTKNEEGYYICYYELRGHGKLSSRKFHLLESGKSLMIHCW